MVLWLTVCGDWLYSVAIDLRKIYLNGFVVRLCGETTFMWVKVYIDLFVVCV